MSPRIWDIQGGSKESVRNSERIRFGISSVPRVQCFRSFVMRIEFVARQSRLYARNPVDKVTFFICVGVRETGKCKGKIMEDGVGKIGQLFERERSS